MWHWELCSRSSIAGFESIAFDYSDVNISPNGCEKFRFGILVLVPLELVTPGFLGIPLLGHRFSFVTLKEARAIFNLPLTFSDVFLYNLQKNF